MDRPRRSATMQSQRPALRIDTDLWVASPYSDLPPDCRITNLSMSGAFIQTTEPLPIETMVALNFQLPDDHTAITIHARVVWTRSIHSVAPPGMGIQFTGIDPDHQNKLAAFIERNS